MKRKNLIKYAEMAGFKNAEILLGSHNPSDILDAVRMKCAAKIAKKINKRRIVCLKMLFASLGLASNLLKNKYAEIAKNVGTAISVT